MRKHDSHSFILSSGRLIEGYRNIIGLSIHNDNLGLSEDAIYFGKDGIIDADYIPNEQRLTVDERVEIAEIMIARWEG